MFLNGPSWPRSPYSVRKNFVLISHLTAVRNLNYKLCASSGPNEYFRMFAFKDPTQREILVGNAFRAGFNDPIVRKKMQRWSEQMPSFGPATFRNPQIKIWLSKNVLMTKERRLQQLLYCLDDKVEAYGKEETFASGLSFFLAFWILLASFFAFALFVLLAEYFHYCYWQKTRRIQVVIPKKRKPLMRPIICIEAANHPKKFHPKTVRCNTISKIDLSSRVSQRSNHE